MDTFLSHSYESLNCKANGGQKPLISHEKVKQALSESSILSRAEKSCSAYFQSISAYSSLNEQFGNEMWDFPMAFSISVHHQVGILEGFLAAFFRPSDSYCIHVDAKAPDEVQKAVAAIVRCYQKLSFNG